MRSRDPWWLSDWVGFAIMMLILAGILIFVYFAYIMGGVEAEPFT